MISNPERKIIEIASTLKSSVIFKRCKSIAFVDGKKNLNIMLPKRVFKEEFESEENAIYYCFHFTPNEIKELKELLKNE